MSFLVTANNYKTSFETFEGTHEYVVFHEKRNTFMALCKQYTKEQLAELKFEEKAGKKVAEWIKKGKVAAQKTVDLVDSARLFEIANDFNQTHKKISASPEYTTYSEHRKEFKKAVLNDQRSIEEMLVELKSNHSDDLVIQKTQYLYSKRK